MKKNLKMIQPKSWKFLGLASALSLAALLLFQNCADTGPEQKDNSSLSDSSPFPFDTTIDTISYMSCSGTGNGANPRAYYTFRVGAYTDNYGIGLNSNFLSGVSSANQRVDIIQSAPSNNGAFLQLSIRQQGDYQTVLGSGSSGIQEGFHYYNFLDTLSSPVIADRLGKLTSASEKVNYFGGVSGLEGRFLEGSLRFFEGEGQSNSVRNKFFQDHFTLMLTYSMPGADPFTARAPDMTSTKTVYGRSYFPSFKLWGNQSGGINRLLSTIVEKDASVVTSATSGTWTCNPYDAYVIVRASDSAYCRTTADPRSFPNTTQGQTDRARLERIRRVLRVEDWWVDVTNGCVVPKNSATSGACYGSQTTIKYWAGASGSIDNTCDATNCPHYVSLCTRN